MKTDHCVLFYLTGSFEVQNFTETYVDNSTFFSDNSVQNPKSKENFLIRLGNKIENVLTKDSFSKIPYGIETQSPSQDDFSPLITSWITYLITTVTNYKIPSGYIFPIPPRDWSKIPVDTYASIFCKSTSSAPTNSKMHLFNTNSITSVKSNSDSTSNPTPHLKLSNSKIRQQIWSRIFNYKQDHNDLKRYDGHNNHWRESKENLYAAISMA